MKTLIIALMLLTACQKTRPETIQAFCAHLVDCFPKASYSGCVIGAEQSDKGTSAELAETEAMTSMSCQALELFSARRGFNLSTLK